MSTPFPELSQDPRAEDFVQNPYPFYDRLRALGPLVTWAEYGFPCAARYDVVNTLLRDRRFGRVNPHAAPYPAHLASFAQVEAASMLEHDPPSHTRLRSSVLRSFVPGRISALAPDLDHLAHRLIDDFPDGPFDLLSHFAEPLPLIAICRLLGVPDCDGKQFLDWSHAMVAMYQARRDRTIEDAAETATKAFMAYIEEAIAHKRKHPGEDVLTILANSPGLSLTEITGTAILLLNAGHEATVHTIGNGVFTMLRQGALEAVAQPLNLAEEVMRFDPPLHMFTRYAQEDLALYGHDLPCGTAIGLLLAGANRDPGMFETPNAFRPNRTRNPHLALGAGVHFCLGAPLARLELMIALPALMARCPDLRLAQLPRYADRYHFHGLKSLMVTR